MKSLAFSCLIRKHIFCSKVSQRGKSYSTLLEPQEVASNAKSCSEVAEHNRDRPTHDYFEINRVNGLAHACHHHLSISNRRMRNVPLRRLNWIGRENNSNKTWSLKQ